LGIATIGTAVVAAILNAIIFFIADAASVWDGIIIMEDTEQEMNVAAIASLTIFGVLGGGIALFTLTRISAENGVQWWRYLAIAVLVLSFGSPLTVADADVPFILTLELTHIVAGVLTIWALPKFSAATE